MDQNLIASAEGFQPPPQHQGSQALPTAQLLPCTVRNEYPHSSAHTKEEQQDHEKGTGVHDQDYGEAWSLVEKRQHLEDLAGGYDQAGVWGGEGEQGKTRRHLHQDPKDQGSQDMDMDHFLITTAEGSPPPP